jgi:hypothetical protein
MSARSGIAVLPARRQTAAQATSLMLNRTQWPDQPQREAIREIVRQVQPISQIRDLTLIFTKESVQEASWLCAYLRAAGVRVMMVACLARRIDVERRARQVSDGPAIVLADMELDLPDAVTQLPGTDELSSLEIWESLLSVSDRARQVLAELQPSFVLRSALRSQTILSVRSWRLGHPFGRLEADVLTADGVFVADGAIEINRNTRMDCRLRDRPVQVRIEAGRVMDLTCGDQFLQRFLQRTLRVHKVDRITAVRLGLRDIRGGYDKRPSLANSCRGAGVRISADPSAAYSRASADLTIDLIGASGGLAS